jgi:hypothetical protein
MSDDLTPNLSAARNDRATQLALTLARELWVVKDRLMVLEAVMAEQGTALRERVDRYQPTAEAKAAIDAERQRFIGEIMAALDAPGDRR